MNDGLRRELEEAFDAWDDDDGTAVAIAYAAVRAWLALPPSEEEIAAAFQKWYGPKAQEHHEMHGDVPWEMTEAVSRAFSDGWHASRAVLVRPPGETT